MKLRFAALAVATAMTTFNSTAATVYQSEDSSLDIGGRIEARANFSKANESDTSSSQFSDASRGRLNIEGKQSVSDGLAFTGKYEFELTETDDGEIDDVSINTRYLYVGAETNYGSIYYGHQNNAVTYLTDWTDMAETFSGYINEYTVTTSDRAKNVLKYDYTNERMTFQLSGNFNSDVDAENSTGVGAVLAYSLPIGLEVGIGYATSDETYSEGSDTAKSNAQMLAAKYVNDNGLWVSVLYQGGQISKLEVVEANYQSADAYLGYSFGDNNVNVTYSYFDAEGLDELDINFVGLEYARTFSDVTLFGSYKINLLNEGKGGLGDNDDNEVMLGLRYSF
ncbi:porin [Vibrio maritimus]|uniref:porin n=1 Tax=Vibrio maritimus TaxID=990268 RepID=UPI003735F895